MIGFTQLAAMLRQKFSRFLLSRMWYVLMYQVTHSA